MKCRWQSLKDNSDLHLFKAPRDDSKPFRLDPKVTVSCVIIWHGMSEALAMPILSRHAVEWLTQQQQPDGTS
jgi:hypothetical protein